MTEKEDEITENGKSDTGSEWETCFDCKYSSLHDGMQSCVWKSGKYLCLTKCDEYEKDWVLTIYTDVCFLMVFIFPIALIISLILYSFGVLK